MTEDFIPHLDPTLLDLPSLDKLGLPAKTEHPRERSYSRLLVQEAARLLERFGAETRIFDPAGLPLPDDAPEDHPRVQELRERVLWSESQVWCSPERRVQGADRLDSVKHGAIRPTQGRARLWR